MRNHGPQAAATLVTDDPTWMLIYAKVVLHSHCICQRWCVWTGFFWKRLAACLRFRLLLLSPAWSACPNGCLSWRIQYDSRRVLRALDTSGIFLDALEVGWDHCQNSDLDPYAHVCCTSKLAPDNSELTKYQYVVHAKRGTRIWYFRTNGLVA